MANFTNGKVWQVDTVGIITRNPVKIQAVTFYPAAVSDVALFHYFLPQEKEATSGTIFGTALTGTISGNDTLTLSAGTSLPSSIADGDFFSIDYSDGSGDNWYNKHDKSKLVALVKTAGNNTVVVVHDNLWTDESTKKYTWSVYTGRKAFALLQPTVANSHESKHIIFPSGLLLPNLACETMSTSAYCLIYLMP